MVEIDRLIKTRHPIAVTPLGGNIGAEIGGMDLADDISDEAASVLWEALLQHKILFFRRQNRLNDDDDNLAVRLGWLTATTRPTNVGSRVYKGRVRDLNYDDDAASRLKTDHWHTDATFLERPHVGQMLRPVFLPPCGGDTLWANTATAYAALPDHLRSFVDQLNAVHSNRWGYADLGCGPDGLPLLAGESRFADTPYYGHPFEAIHPLICVHPRSGERIILAGTHMRHILGLSQTGSADLYRMLKEYIHRPENTVRWHWELGDLAVWDNLATQHYACRDYTGPRAMKSITLAGNEILVGVDGRKSVARVGDMSILPEKGRLSGRL